MDKQTLSHYGWIVVMVLTLSVMLALGTPLGRYIGRGVSNLAISLVGANDKAVDSDNIDQMGDYWENYLDGNTNISDLEEKYKFEYYSTLNGAVNDVNAETIGKNADANKEDAIAGVYTDAGKTYVVLLRDSVEESKVNPKVNMTINLGGHTLSAYDESVICVDSGNVTIDGRLHGSTIKNNYTGSTIIQCIKATGASNVIVKGGTFISLAAEDGSSRCRGIYATNTSSLNLSNATIFATSNNNRADGVTISAGANASISNCTMEITDNDDGFVCAIYNSGNVTIDNCSITTTSNGDTYCNYNLGTSIISNCILNANGNKGNTYALFTNSASTFSISNCSINANGKEGTVIGVGSNGPATILNCSITATTQNGSSFGVYTWEQAKTTIMTNCIVKAYSNYSPNIDLSGYASISTGIHNTGVATLNDCYVIGVHSAVDNHGNLYVNNGTYEGYGHGGFYFGGNGSISYINNAIIRECDMPDGYADLGAGCNGSGFYIGGRTGYNNISVYMDNCSIYGSRQPIVLRGGSGEQNNSLYISNSTINTDYTVTGIRIDNNTHRIYIGKGNNFTATNTNQPTAVIETNETYVKN